MLESHVIAAVAEMAYKDLRTEAGLHLLEVLEDIFDNMPEALALLEQVKEMQAYLVFIGSQYRDGNSNISDIAILISIYLSNCVALRGAKRDFVYVLTVWCDFFECNNIIRSNNLLYMDTSQCLHFDKARFQYLLKATTTAITISIFSCQIPAPILRMSRTLYMKTIIEYRNPG